MRTTKGKYMNANEFVEQLNLVVDGYLASDPDRTLEDEPSYIFNVISAVKEAGVIATASSK